MPASELWDLVRNPHGRIDGSAVYGVLVHSGKPAIGDLSGTCCNDKKGRPFDNVALLDVTVSHLDLNESPLASLVKNIVNRSH